MHSIVVISYNNHFYVKNTLTQAAQYGLTPIVIDNASPYKETRRYLKEIEGSVRLIRLPDNHGYVCWQLPEVYKDLPERFFLTDPDLQWNPRLPHNFPSILDALCTQFSARKVGFALNIIDDGIFQDDDYFCAKSIHAWESQSSWGPQVAHPSYELYVAAIDTTFHLFDKTNVHGKQLRIAGDFTAKHPPGIATWSRRSHRTTSSTCTGSTPRSRSSSSERWLAGASTGNPATTAATCSS